MNDDMQELENLASEAGLDVEGDCGCGSHDSSLDDVSSFGDCGCLDELEAEGAAVAGGLTAPEADFGTFSTDDPFDGSDDFSSLEWGDDGAGDSCELLEIAKRNPGLKITVSF